MLRVISTFRGKLALGVAASFVAAGCGGSQRPAQLATTVAPAQAKPPGDVLFVVSAAQPLASGSQRPTGYFLGEFYEAYAAVKAAGHSVVVATTGGRAPAIDPESLKSKYWDDEVGLEKARRLVLGGSQQLQPISLKQARAQATCSSITRSLAA